MKNNYLICICLLILTGSIGCSTREYASSRVSNITPIVQVYNQEETNLLPDKASLNDYILFALKESAELRAAYNNYSATLLRAPQVSVLPEPRLSYGYYINSIETRSGPMQHRVGLSQPIPWFGKLSLKEKIADHEAKAAYYSFLYKKNKLVFEVVKAFYELAYLKDASDITEANLELLKRWEQVLAQRYRSQSGNQSDLIRVQVELGKLEDKLQELRDLRDPLTAHFNALLSRPVSSTVNVLSEPELDISSSSVLSYSRESLENILQEQNPELELLRALVEASKKGIKLANKQYYPDFAIGADYTFVGERAEAGLDSGDDGLAALFSINIPINFSKYNAGVKEASYRKKAAEETLHSRSYKLSSELTKNLFDISDSRRRINLFKNTLIPKAEESLESTFTSFEAGDSGFLDLLDTERQLLEFQLMLSRAEADLAIYNSKLRSLVGDFNHFDEVTKGDTQ